MKRYVMAAISLLSFFVLAAAALPASAASSAHTQAQTMRVQATRAHATKVQATAARTTRADSRYSLEDPLCQSYNSLCVDTSSTPPGGYVGHDEPSVLFKSGQPGSGNDMTYTMTLPRDPKKQPNATGVRRDDLEFPAAAHVLVRPHAVRHPVSARVHSQVPARL